MARSGHAPTTRSSRLVGIEGMRAIAAFSILTYHVWLYSAPRGASADLGPATKAFDNLRAGVTLFFVLSGFLLFRPYVAAALRHQGTPSLRKYLRNRALRILPAYWAILLVVAIAFEHQLLRAPEQLAANAFLLQNYSNRYALGAGIVPAWSLAIEVVFYLCVPLLGLLAIRLAAAGRPALRAVTAPVALMVIVGVAAKIALRVHPSLGQAWELSFPTHCDWFAGGMGLAVLRTLWEDGRFELPRHWRLPALAVGLALGAVSVKAYYGGQLSYLEYQSPIVISCTIALAFVVFAEPGSRLLSVLGWRPFEAAGLVSYSVFLWHDPLLRFFRREGLTQAGTLGFAYNLAIVTAATAVLSVLSYRFVEKPALSRKRSWATPRRAASPQPGPADDPPPAPELPSTELLPAPVSGS